MVVEHSLETLKNPQRKNHPLDGPQQQNATVGQQGEERLDQSQLVYSLQVKFWIDLSSFLQLWLHKTSMENGGEGDQI